jgi:hypothetical protein
MATQYINDEGIPETFIHPTPDDTAAIIEVRKQRLMWGEFMKKRGNDKTKDINERWLWQYWKPENRPNQLSKKLGSIFGFSKVQVNIYIYIYIYIYINEK